MVNWSRESCIGKVENGSRRGERAARTRAYAKLPKESLKKLTLFNPEREKIQPQMTLISQIKKGGKRGTRHSRASGLSWPSASVKSVPSVRLMFVPRCTGLY